PPGHCVLVVDDDEAQALVRAAFDGGVEVVAQRRPRRALSLLRARRFDALIVGMPRSGGSVLAFLRQLHGELRPPRIVLLTEMRPDEVDALHLFVSAVLPPLPPLDALREAALPALA